ncbi:unnamed protein product [Rhizopus stolonifer]
MTTVRKISLTKVFSNDQLKELKEPNTLEPTLYLSKTTCPSKLYLFHGINRRPKAIIHCDVQVFETLKEILKQPLARLLFSTYFKIESCAILLQPDYLSRSFRINWNESRQWWNLASQSDKTAFVSVYYSVLGGAYCSLGKQNSRYAYRAGELALKQIRLAQDLKDPLLESKCWLYFAEDLIQLKRFKSVEKILSFQRSFVEKMQDSVVRHIHLYIFIY